MFYPAEMPFQITELSTTHVLDRTFTPDFYFDGEKHDFWEIVYVSDGKLEVTEDENVYIMSEHDIVFHAPNEFHRLRSADNTSPRVFNLSFRAEGELPKLLTGGILSLSAELHKEFMEIFSMLRDFVQFCNKQIPETPVAYEIGCRLSSFFLRLTRESQAKNSISTSAGARTYRSVVEMMHREVYSNLSLEEFSGRSFISVSYLKKLFARYAGISPKGYYANLRVAEAQKLLSTGIPISDVAEKLNFSSASYFTLFFKNHTGITPMQYRKK